MLHVLLLFVMASAQFQFPLFSLFISSNFSLLSYYPGATTLSIELETTTPPLFFVLATDIFHDEVLFFTETLK